MGINTLGTVNNTNGRLSTTNILEGGLFFITQSMIDSNIFESAQTRRPALSPSNLCHIDYYASMQTKIVCTDCRYHSFIGVFDSYHGPYSAFIGYVSIRTVNHPCTLLLSPYEAKYGKESSGYRIHRGSDPQYGMPEVAIVVELIPLGHCIINLVQCNVCP